MMKIVNFIIHKYKTFSIYNDENSNQNYNNNNRIQRNIIFVFVTIKYWILSDNYTDHSNIQEIYISNSDDNKNRQLKWH